MDEPMHFDPEKTLEFVLPDLETFDFSIERLAQRVEEAQAKPIYFMQMDLGRYLFGARVMVAMPGQVVEYVICNEKLPAFHRDHVKVHEMAHIMLGHPTLLLHTQELNWLLQNAPEAATLWPEICCRASDPRQFSGARLARDQDAERLTRLLYQRLLLSRQKNRWHRNSSQADLDDLFSRLGVA